MMSFLKRENGAIFTRDGLIRQEEALMELDLSLDDWISKIEQAENRRLRIRQKVLEHFCAAITLEPNGVEAQATAMPTTSGGVGHATRLQGLQRGQEQTPPRSPVDKTASPKLTSSSPSTQATNVSSAIPEYEVKPMLGDSPKIGDPVKRTDVQSIKIYADGNVLDLFSDIEQAIDNMFDYDDKRATFNHATGQ